MVLLGLARSGFLKQRRLNPTTRPQGPDGSTDLESRSTTSFLGRICLTAELYEHLATFVSSTYTIKEGDKSGNKNLSSKVAQQTWSGLIQHQQRRFGKSADAATKVRRPRV